MEVFTPEFIDNVHKTLSQSLKEEIKPGSKLSIAAACFSIYAYQELQKELKDIDELRFIFTSPTFVAEKAKKEKREFYIPRLNRERSLYGTEFEVKLRNELNQKAIAKECAEWIKKKAVFKSNSTQQNMPSFMNVDETAYNPVKEFTAVDLGVEKGNNAAFAITKMKAPMSNSFLQMFEQFWQNKEIMQDVTNQVIENISSAYNENSPEFIYFVTLYNIFKEFLDDISEDVLPKEATGFKQSAIWNKLYNFQQDACLAIINKLEKYNGCILADSVGLGKTFTALSVIKYFECRNNRVLVLCPKKLANNWNIYKGNYKNNPIAADRLRYDVLFHTDLNLWICMNDPEICDFMTNKIEAGKLSIQKCDKCDGYLIARQQKDGRFMLGCTNYKINGTGCDNVIFHDMYYRINNLTPEPAIKKEIPKGYERKTK
ncbi:MAG: DEAD/DEAH box helicase family protein [Treponema sp.]|nr:DEAD/DEAH box helicase family protein [Treponema sp.]